MLLELSALIITCVIILAALAIRCIGKQVAEWEDNQYDGPN